MHRKLLGFALVLGLSAGLASLGLMMFGGNSNTTEAAPQHQLVVALRGDDLVGVPSGDLGLGDVGTCFTGDLVDLKTNNVIGTAVDCLDNITDVSGKKQPPGTQLTLDGTAFFNFPQGQLVSEAKTTVSALQYIPGLQDGFTHTTGSPAPSVGSNIISGTKDFQNADGTVRLSGLVNLHASGNISFDCVFVINLG